MNNPPFCVATSAWLQVVRNFTPRTEDFDRTIVDLLATPYLRYRGAGVNSKALEEIVGRIDQFAGADAELGAAVLADTALVEQIAHAETDEAKTELIENAFIMKTTELREHLEAAESRQLQTLGEIRALEEERRHLQTERDLIELRELERVRAAQRELATESARVQRLEEETAAARIAEAKVRLEAETRVAVEREARLNTERELGRELKNLRRRQRIGVAAMVAAAGLLLSLWTLMFGGPSGSASRTLALTSSAALMLASLLVAFGRSRGGTIGSWLLALGGLAGTIYSILESG